MYPLCTRPLVCMLLGFELMHLPAAECGVE